MSPKEVSDQDVAAKQRAEVIATFKHLKPGDQVDLQIRPDVVPIRLKTILLGYDESNFVIISLPLSAFVEHSAPLKSGTICVARMLIEGEAGQCIAFKS
ncbi:flagellar brake domain-containing protein [Alteromonas lipolytica]|uniref:Type III secretion system flagellar brake protein YcgR PilZN domain-containing protein n=1 Tax=Alteromonas lipolytica TaxID=1856405 RepID=A0A1E8FAD5_9ALTE|nr:flagellar brake domain-containing protein [Alteromonas lipolytica]OFI32875.1 hypothetical protein BFC17_00950 [Alteromonas lipolytica]GGF64549.1 hypothetical protein GCM10011338_16190 [Alteromonas lipolytica]